MRSNGNSSSASNFVSFAERLKSFSKKSPKWPHPETFLANPNSLAAAGFYFSPSNDNKDAVSCFICQKGLADWDPTDDPAAIHFDKCSTCPWATLKCISDGPDSEGRYNFPSSRIPSSKEMEKARLETFFAPGGKSWWPQDGRNKGPSSKLMAKAGFIFTPTSSSKKDDTCSCIYCGIELSGWQVDDDPMEEHCRRQEKNGPCPFFTVQEAPAKSQQNLKTNNTLSKRNTSSRSKSKHKATPSLTVQPVIEEESAAAPPPSLTAQPAAEEEDPLPSHPKKTKTVTSKPKAKSKAKPKSRPKSPPIETMSKNIPQVSPMDDTKQPKMEEISKPPGREEEEKQELGPEPELDPRPAPIQVQEQLQQHRQPEPETEHELKDEPQSRPQQDEEADLDLEPKEEQNQAPLTPVKSRRLSVSIPSFQTLTEAERLMTVEQWIRAEMQRQYELFEAHGRSRIEAFKLRAEEVAERIEQL